MRPKRMIGLCDDVLDMLDLLEGALSERSDLGIAEKVYTYILQTRELKHIAQKETAVRMTKEQVLHINKLMAAVDEMIDTWPSSRFH